MTTPTIMSSPTAPVRMTPPAIMSITGRLRPCLRSPHISPSSCRSHTAPLLLSISPRPRPHDLAFHTPSPSCQSPPDPQGPVHPPVNHRRAPPIRSPPVNHRRAPLEAAVRFMTCQHVARARAWRWLRMRGGREVAVVAAPAPFPVQPRHSRHRRPGTRAEQRGAAGTQPAPGRSRAGHGTAQHSGRRGEDTAGRPHCDQTEL